MHRIRAPHPVQNCTVRNGELRRLVMRSRSRRISKRSNGSGELSPNPHRHTRWVLNRWRNKRGRWRLGNELETRAHIAVIRRMPTARPGVLPRGPTWHWLGRERKASACGRGMGHRWPGPTRKWGMWGKQRLAAWAHKIVATPECIAERGRDWHWPRVSAAHNYCAWLSVKRGYARRGSGPRWWGWVGQKGVFGPGATGWFLFLFLSYLFYFQISNSKADSNKVWISNLTQCLVKDPGCHAKFILFIYWLIIHLNKCFYMHNS
jgi:hypothetical protein